MTIRLTGAEEVRRSPLLTFAKVGDEAHTDGFIDSQSTKLHLSLGAQSPGQDVIADSMSTGNSVEYRRLLADRDRIEQVQTQNDVLDSIMKSDPSEITPEVINVVQGLSIQELQSPDLSAIVEKKYAKLYTDMAVSSIENGVVDEAMQEDFDGSMDMIDRAEAVAFKRNYATTVADNLQKESEGQSWLGTAWDFTERLVPFVEWYQKHNAIDGAEDFTSSILPGSNLEEQYAYIWSLSDPSEFKATLDKTVEELKGRNLSVAQSWLEGLFSYGSSDSTLDNLLGVLDVASVIPATKLGKLGNALKGVAKASTVNPKQIGRITKALGNYEASSVAKNVEDLYDKDFFKQNIRNISELENSVPSISSPIELLTGAEKSVPPASYLRLKQALLDRADLVRRFLTEPNQIDRATPDELVKYADILREEYKRHYPSVQQNVIDVSIQNTGDVGNVYQAKVILGHKDGTLFESEKQARNYFKRFVGGTDDFQIVQNGQGYQIEINKAVDESKFLTDLSLGTTQRTPESIATTFGGLVRSPNYLVSRESELARSTAVTSAELLTDIFDEIAAPFRSIKKNELSELEDLMVVNNQKNEYYKNYAEFEQAFYDRFKKKPSFEQADAYFGYVQINDLDLIVRDLDWYRQKARLGLEDFTVGETSFEGKIIDSLPYGSKDRFAVTIAKDGKPAKPISSRFLTEKHKAEIKKLVDQGYKIIQVADQSFAVGDNYAGFVVAKDFKRSRVGVKNIDRKAGGHKVHQYPFYIKQGNVSVDTEVALYKGDVTLFNIRNEAEGKELIELFETARQKLKAKAPDAVQFIRDNLPISPKEFLSKVKTGVISLDTPFTLTKKGLRTIDMGVFHDTKNFVDLTKSEHNLTSRLTGRYGGERSTTDVDIIRSEGASLWRTETAPRLTPMETLREASQNMLSVRAMNDYTLKTFSDYVREFGDILEGTREEQLSSGLSVLVDPRFKAGASESRKASAMNVSRAYNNLMNYGTPLDRKLEAYKDKLVDTVLPKFSERTQDKLAPRLLGRIKDPGQFLRSIAFDFKLGLFNPQQYFVQANGLVNIASVAGTNGFKGGLVYPIFRAGLMTARQNILEGLASKAQAVGLMKREEFLESMALYKRSGFNNIGGDVAYLDEIRTPEMREGSVKTGVKSVLQWGRTPFQEGERLVRVAGWNAAYFERKAFLNGRPFSRRDEAWVLQRAKDLTGNMTRESNAAWQKGYAAVFTQFFGYQARIMEQFLGKKLTGAEKLRLFTGYSAVYGMPVAMGATVGVVPIRDVVIDTMLSMGVDPDDSTIEPFIDGFASSFLEFMTGTEYNVASRFGPGGLPTFYDFMRGDKDFSELVLGASGSVLLDTIRDTIPILKGMHSEYLDFDGGYYNLTADDFILPLHNISSVDNGVKLWHVWNTGVWASRNEVDILEMDLPDAFMAALTGLQPAKIEDAFAKQRASVEFKEHVKGVQQEIIKEYRRVMKMDDGPEREREIRRLKARMIIEGLSPREQAQTWKYAADREMITDVFFEKYEELQKRKDEAEKRIEDFQ